jgi:hypothetical protein
MVAPLCVIAFVVARRSKRHACLARANNFALGIAHNHVAQRWVGRHAPSQAHQKCKHRYGQDHRKPDPNVELLKHRRAISLDGAQKRSPRHARSISVWVI